MSIVAHSRPFVVGVDTHAKSHVYAIIAAATGALLQTREFPTTSAGINRAIAWAARLTGADLATLWVIEGAASYGALLTGAVGAAGYEVSEAARMDARAHHGVGKSDPLDAHRIGAAVLPLDEQQLRRPRLNEGVRAALRILVTSRESMTTDRTRAVNALTALARVNELGLDARKKLTETQIAEVSQNQLGAPTAYLAAGALILVFAVGFTSMGRHPFVTIPSSYRVLAHRGRVVRSGRIGV